jgi:MFS transporter, ACS family, glucarate transporter
VVDFDVSIRNPVTSTSPTRVRWFLVFWLFVLSAVSYLDRVNISIAGGAILDAYHLNNLQLGYVFSSLLAGYALFQTVGGQLADRFGPRLVLAAGVVWWGIFTALTALIPANVSNPLWWFIAVRFLLGAGEAVIYPAANQFVSRWIPVRERGIANGWIFAGVGAGAGLTPPLITHIMLRYGWRSSFWVCAIIGLVVGVIWYLAARDNPADHPRVVAAELAAIRSGLTTASDQPSEAPRVPWRRVIQSREVWALTIGYFCYGYVAWIFFSWFFRYLAKVRGLDLKASSFYSMLPFIGMLVGCLVGGVVNDRLTKWRGPRVGRSYLAVVAMAIAGIFIVFGARAEGVRVASIVLAGGAAALYLSQSSFWSVTADIAGGSAGSVSGFMNTGAQLGGFVTASLTAWIGDHYGWTTSFLVAAAFCFLGAFCWMFVNPLRKLD